MRRGTEEFATGAAEREGRLLAAIEGRLGHFQGRLVDAMIDTQQSQRRNDAGPAKNHRWPREAAFGGEEGGGSGDRARGQRPHTAPRQRGPNSLVDKMQRKMPQSAQASGDDRTAREVTEVSVLVPISQPAPLHDARPSAPVPSPFTVRIEVDTPRLDVSASPRSGSAGDAALLMSSTGQSIVAGLQSAASRLEALAPLLAPLDVEAPQLADMFASIYVRSPAASAPPARPARRLRARDARARVQDNVRATQGGVARTAALVEVAQTLTGRAFSHQVGPFPRPTPSQHVPCDLPRAPDLARSRPAPRTLEA